MTQMSHMAGDLTIPYLTRFAQAFLQNFPLNLLLDSLWNLVFTMTV